MKITISQLRADIYNLLDHVLESEVPLEVERNGRLLKIIVCDNSQTSFPQASSNYKKLLKLKGKAQFEATWKKLKKDRK